jgi:L-arabinose isomerase
MENVALKKAPASVSWYFDSHHLHYSYSACSKFVENLYVVQKVLELEIVALIDGDKTVEDFVAEFREEHDIIDRRKNARELLGLEHNEIDIDVIDKAYKNLAKEHHPDRENGDVVKFKEINHAHKVLKRELL